MKNVKNAHYYQIDNKVKNITAGKGVEILESKVAYKKYPWVRKYLKEKPSKGYFIWVKKQVDFPLMTCISLASYKSIQKLSNLLVVEEGLDIKANAFCNALKNDLCGVHQANGIVILKKGAKLEYLHLHSWGEKDLVEPNYEFYLEKDSQLNYYYKNFDPPKELNFKNYFEAQENSQVNLKVYLLGRKTRVKLEEILDLKGKNSKGLITLKLVADKKSNLEAISKITAFNQNTGHLECQGLLIDDGSSISLVPNLVCKNKKAQLTHEASIGKISEEELTYLRTRGLTEKQAINLIINGFLEK